MTFEIPLYEYPSSEDQYDNLHFPTIKRTRAWDNFIRELEKVDRQNFFEARDRRLHEDYCAYINYKPVIDTLVFETEQDMMLFLLRWS